MKFRLALCLMSILLICGIFAFSMANIKAVSANSTDKNISDIASAESSFKYTIKPNNGKLGVFKYSTDVLIKEYDIYISSLPSYDAELISKGINIKNDDELRNAIEDYTS